MCVCVCVCVCVRACARVCVCVRACVCDFCHLFIEFSGSEVKSLLWSIVPATLHPLAGEDERKLVHTEREGERDSLENQMNLSRAFQCEQCEASGRHSCSHVTLTCTSHDQFTTHVLYLEVRYTTSPTWYVLPATVVS